MAESDPPGVPRRADCKPDPTDLRDPYDPEHQVVTRNHPVDQQYALLLFSVIRYHGSQDVDVARRLSTDG